MTSMPPAMVRPTARNAEQEGPRVLEATVAGKNKVEVRGGRIKPAKGGGAWVEIGADPIIVGRNAACKMVLDDGKVSAVHAELVATEQGVRVRDLGSRNGTFVGGVRVGEIYLAPASKLRIGETDIVFEPVLPQRIAVSTVPSFGPM